MKISDLILQENSPFDPSTTEMPYYDNMIQNPTYFEQSKGIKSKIIDMSPEEYIDQVSKSTGVSVQHLKQARDHNTIKSYAEQMSKDPEQKFPTLTLDYTGARLSQEGLHRAFAAIMAGVETVPVLVIELTPEEKQFLSQR